VSAAGRVAEIIERAAGIVVAEGDRERVEELVRELARQRTGGDVDQLLVQLRRDPTHDGWRVLLAAITVKESFLFRAPRQFEVLRHDLLPELVRRRRSRTLSLWCAGCARGEEAVTAAMVLAEAAELAGWSWRVLATDVDEHALQDARAGRYGERAVARVPEELRERYLSAAGDRYVVAPSLRRRIEYRQLNLVRLPLAVPAAPHDVILLRNVLIYFRADLQQRVVTAVAEALADDGFLFLGPSESLLQLEVPLVPEDRDGCFVYRKPSAPRRRAAAAEAPVRSSSPPAAAPPEATDPGVPGRAAAGEDRSVAAPSTEEVAAAIAADSLAVAIGLASTATAVRPEDAELRGLLGIALHRLGDVPAAIRELRAALYLDPSLAQVRVELAQALEGVGRHESALQQRRRAVATVSSGPVGWLPGWRELGLPEAEEILRRCRSIILDEP